MTKKFSKSYDQAKEILLGYLKSLLRGKKSRIVDEYVRLKRYDITFEAEFQFPYKLEKILIEGDQLLIQLVDEDGKMQESYVRDESMNDIVGIIEVLDK